MATMEQTAQRMDTKFITRVGIFGAISVLLYTVKGLYFSIPIFPAFLEFGFSEVPIFIAGYSFGPFAAAMIAVLRLLIKLPFSTTASVGEFADLIYTLSFVLPAVFYYQMHRTKPGVVVAFLIGFAFQLVVTSVLNALVITDLYLTLYYLTPEQFVSIVQVTNPSVTDVHWSLVLWVYLPFNILKNTLIVAITFLTYKRISGLINSFSKQQTAQQIQSERYALVYFLASAIFPIIGLPLWIVFKDTNKKFASATLNGVLLGLIIWLILSLSFIF